MFPRGNLHAHFVDVLASCWNIFADRVTYYTELHKPIIQSSQTAFTIGRVTLPCSENPTQLVKERTTFAYTSHVLRNMEKVAACTLRGEPVLLVGETGTGKTAMIQHLAEKLHQKLVVHNLNEQTESGDLLGGFKPVDIRLICEPVLEKFEKLFPKTFSRQVYFFI